MAVNNELNPVLGIDLGTTFSAAARWNGREPEIYQMRDGSDTMQSIVFCDPKTAEFLVGKLAYRRGGMFPESMVMGVKRHMDDASERIKLGEGHEFTPIELSAKILERIAADVADRFPSGKFKARGTVVTVPYYFKAHQCDNTRRAAELAGIDCTGILQEPIAASLAYAWQQIQEHPDREGTENILVFDLGGGTFDLTLFKLEQGREKLLFEVLATGGDDRLGGMDFDNSLVEFLIQKGGLRLEGLSDKDARGARQKLLEAAINTKLTLSATTEEYVTVPNVTADQHLDTQVTRAEFETCIATYIAKIERIMEDLWSMASGVGVKQHQVDRVILVGGSSRIPRMRAMLADSVGEDKIWGNARPDLCVAEGAAMYAAYLDDREVFGRDIEIRTRTCHALGLETAGGRFHVLIPANRKTPCEIRQSFQTDTDDMTSIDVQVYQGASDYVKSNSHIGTLNVTGLPAKKAGEVEVVVTFKVSEEQTLSVIVEAAGTRKAASLKFA